MERIRIEVIYHDDSKAIYERHRPDKTWLYSEEVPGENNNSPLLSKLQEVHSGSVMQLLIDSFLMMSSGDPLGSRNR
jgi:hypothetical protein